MSLPPLQPAQRIKPHLFEARLSLLFCAIFLSLGVHLPYFPLWLEAQGFDAAQIGVVLATPMFLRVVTTPLITSFADRAGDRVNVLIAISIGAVLLSLGYFLPPSYGVVLAVSALLAVFWAPQTPLADSLALSGVRRFGCSYSKLRIWGSLSFVVASFAGGLILAATGPGSVPAMITIGLACVLLATFAAPRLGPPRQVSVLSASALEGGAKLLSRYFVLFIAGVGIINASHGFLFGFMSIYWKSIGIGDAMIGALWTWAVVAEVCIFFLYDRLFGGAPATRVLAMAGFWAIVRWIVYPLVEPLGLGVPGFFFVQGLHALSTGLLLIGMQKMIAESVPEERTGGAQGIAFFSIGFGMAAVTLLSGPLYQRYGIDGIYAMAGLSAVGLGLILMAGVSPRAQPRAD